MMPKVFTTASTRLYGGGDNSTKNKAVQQENVDIANIDVKQYERIFQTDFDQDFWLEKHPDFHYNESIKNKNAKLRFLILLLILRYKNRDRDLIDDNKDNEKQKAKKKEYIQNSYKHIQQVINESFKDYEDIKKWLFELAKKAFGNDDFTEESEKIYKWANTRLHIETAPFIWKFLWNRGINEPENFPDILMYIYEYILIHITEYLYYDLKTDVPRFCLMQPTTFITRLILHSLTEAYSSVTKKTTRYYSGRMQKVIKAIDELMADGFSEPTAAEIAAYLGNGWTIHMVEDTMKRILFQTAVSLESMSYDLADDTLDPLDAVLEQEKNDLLYAAIDTQLSPKEKDMIYRNNGLGDYNGKPQTYKEIAIVYETDDKSVHNIIVKAQRKIRRDNKLRSLYTNRTARKDESITIDHSHGKYLLTIDDSDEIIDGEKPPTPDLPI